MEPLMESCYFLCTYYLLCDFLSDTIMKTNNQFKYPMIDMSYAGEALVTTEAFNHYHVLHMDNKLKVRLPYVEYRRQCVKVTLPSQ